MPQPNTLGSLTQDIAGIGLKAGMTVMVHSSLSQVGWTVGGPFTLIRALLDIVGQNGTLVMPAESGQLINTQIRKDFRTKAQMQEAIHEQMPVFDLLTTPTTLGVVPESFRTIEGTRRSNHPLVSVCANGHHAAAITCEHSEAFGEGLGTPFEKLYTLGGYTLLLGVGFNRCTSLHYAESLVPQRRTTVHRYLALRDGVRVWVEVPNMANDDGEHFPVVGEAFLETGKVFESKIGKADAMLFSTVDLVDFAVPYFAKNLATNRSDAN